MILGSFALLSGSLLLVTGCGSNARLTAAPALSLSPSATTVALGSTVTLQSNAQDGQSSCAWASSDESVLASLGGGQFQGQGEGQATVSADCGTAKAVSMVVVSPKIATGPVLITKGGTYAGNWVSSDPNVSAVTITTDDPVTIQNSQVSGPGNLISIIGKAGANVTIKNVTGTALNPNIAGRQRGAFVTAAIVNSLVVRQCTIVGAKFGVKAFNSNPKVLRVINNVATNLEDRASDGKGGFETARPELGHFVLFHQINAAQGAEIGWNQVLQTIGQSSIEDVINIYKSQGVSGNQIRVHDNYLQGYSSTTTPQYTGNGLIADGDSSSLVTAYVLFQSNQMVHTAGGGIGIANGHDIVARNNRIVSCGQDGNGVWYATPTAEAIVIWNYYNAPNFYNNIITTTGGGLVVPGTNGGFASRNTLANAVNTQDPSNSVAGNKFTDPCLVNKSIYLAAETAEWTSWQTKLQTYGETIGDQHNH